MRVRPISQDLQDIDNLKELDLLLKEITYLLASRIKLDKRTIRNERDKAIHYGKLSLYSKLYKEAREKFINLKRTDKKGKLYHKPKKFEELITDITYDRIRIIKVESPQFTKQYLIDFLEKSLQMKKEYFNRNDQEIINSVFTDTLVEFIEKHKHLTNEEVLQNAYHEIKGKHEGKDVKDSIKDRTGIDNSSDPLGGINPATGEPLHPDIVDKLDKPQKLKFKHAGSIIEGVTMGTDSSGKFVVKGERGYNYRVKMDDVVELVEEESQAKDIKITTTTTQPIKTTTVLIGSTEKVFKKLDKDSKYNIIEKLWDEGVLKCGEVKKKVEEMGYEVGHYDDIYNIFVKVKKDKNE